MTTPREELQRLEDELKSQVPEPLHNMLKDKESRDEAKEKFLSRKKRETVICPPTCSGTLSFYYHKFVWSKPLAGIKRKMTLLQQRFDKQYDFCFLISTQLIIIIMEI